MSCYTHLSITVKMHPPLSNNEFIKLRELMIGNCSISKKINIVTPDDIDFDVTFNYGFEKALAIIKLLEEKIEVNGLVKIGSIYSEGYSFHRPMDLILTPFKKILAVMHDSYDTWAFTENTYTIMGSDGKFKSYSGYNNDVTRDGSIIHYLKDVSKI